ncbi:MAG TPA: hypothetical protein VK737_00500 [Opitutales bacterium]|jgi:hypothetical protein|nr:hypothetical protein [Opitutales bacterium]
MNLVWHILKKDLQRLGPFLVMLAAVLLFKAEFLRIVWELKAEGILNGGVLFQNLPTPLNGLDAIGMITSIELGSRLKNLLLGFSCSWDFIFLMLLVFAVLLDDSPLGEKSFWRTRPIAGWQMFAAKAIFVLLASLPLQVAAQAWVNLSPGSPAHHWYSAVGSLVMTQILWISFPAVAVMLWRNPILGLITFSGIILAYYGWINLLMALFLPDGQSYNPFLPKHISGAIVIWIGTAILTAWWMYGHRRRSMGFLIMAAGLTVIFTLLSL